MTFQTHDSIISWSQNKSSELAFLKDCILPGVSTGGSDGKESACNAGDLDAIPGPEDPLEKETATHSSTFACGIPWTEESGELQSMRLQRVRHNWETNIHICCLGEWESYEIYDDMFLILKILLCNLPLETY